MAKQKKKETEIKPLPMVVVEPGWFKNDNQYYRWRIVTMFTIFPFIFLMWIPIIMAFFVDNKAISPTTLYITLGVVGVFPTIFILYSLYIMTTSCFRDVVDDIKEYKEIKKGSKK